MPQKKLQLNSHVKEEKKHFAGMAACTDTILALMSYNIGIQNNEVGRVPGWYQDKFCP